MVEFRTSKREPTGLIGFSQLIRPWSWHLILVVVFVGGLALADMVLPWALAILIDSVFPSLSEGRGWNLLGIILVSICAIYVLRNVLFYASRMLSMKVSEQVCFNLRQRLFDHLQQLGMGFYKSNRPGQISSRVMDDTFRIQTFIQDKLPTLLRYIIEFQIIIILLYVVNWRLALASTIVLPLHLLTFKKFYLPIKDSHHRAQEHLAEAHGTLIETFLGAQVVKGFSAEKRESDSFLQTIRAGRDVQIKTQRFQFAQKVVADLFVGAGTVLLLGYGAWEVYVGSMSVGLFLMFFWYVRMLYPAVLEVISGTGHFSRTSASIDRVMEMLDEPVSNIAYDMRSRTQALNLVGPIEFNDVSFSYGDESEVLQHINLHIDAGEHIAITGPSGGGKSTLISLLPRFTDPTSGSISVGGKDSRSIRLQDIRAMFGVAFQDAFLFKASILDNLRYARPSATAQEIVDACRITGAHDFIKRLPDEYHTSIGERGGELSHGEKQRINLARAIVRKPQTLIIDETTASIDATAAKRIITAILEHMTGRTVIIVTHDPTILQLVQRVITLDEKTIISDHYADGSHMKHPTTKTTNQSHIGPTAGALLLAVSMFAGCNSTTTNSTIEMTEPISSGLIIDSEEPVDLTALADAIDELVSPPATPRTLSADSDPPPSPHIPTPSEIADLVTEELPTTSRDIFIQLHRMNPVEITEIITLLSDQYASSLEYAPSIMLEGVLPVPPDDVTEIRSIARRQGDITKIIRFGYRSFKSQPPQLWIQGIGILDNELINNPDISTASDFTNALLQDLEEMRSSLLINDLEKQLVQLSYVDASTAIEMLNSFGLTTFSTPSEVPDQVVWSQLPYVALIPDPTGESTGLVGTSGVSSGSFGLTMVPTTAGALPSNMVSSPMTQLIVFFDRAHPEHFSAVTSLLDEFIDRPARQIFIEGMILEINEDGLNDLGIDWNLSNTPNLLTIDAGQANAGTDNDTLGFSLQDLDLVRPFNSANSWLLDIDLRALIREGKAEILSRPSVLTLNNRQSTIRVGKEIPIATSTAGLSNADMLAFNFKYLPTGIMLNIRPRISADGTEVSMLIDTIVSSAVLGADLEIRDTNDKLLASAPTISSRRVQTYGRIPNDTPFIIGGLVNSEHNVILDSVPFLSDIPFVGDLFKSEKTTSTKTEVIIVLTPHVLPDNDHILSAMPKDDPRFDHIGNKLFRDTYRIRHDDVYDLAFIEQNEPLQMYRRLANLAIDNNFTLRSNPAFIPFEGNHFPGESILVTRMVYEITKKLNLADPIPLPRLAFFEEEQSGAMGVKFLDEALAQQINSHDVETFFDDFLGRAFVITFVEGESVPQLKTVHCQNRTQWRDLTWKLNQTSPSGANKRSVVIHNESDLVRLRRAVALKHLVELNAGSAALSLEHFKVGQYIMIPDLDPKQVHIIDEDVAKYFYQTEHYYSATLQAIDDGLDALENALSHPEIQPLIAD